jgi:Fe(3+) dicitrate transport protein
VRVSFFIILFAICHKCFSQIVTVSGSLQNEESATPVRSGQVCFDELHFSVDSNGYFKVHIQAKNYVFRTKTHDYKTFSQKLLITKDTHLVLFLIPKVVALDEVTVHAEKDNNFGISRLNNVEGTTIYAGKKSEAVYVQDLNANLAANNSRQVFSKVPGINVFENDGSGATIGIGGRGLNPNRIANFNTRQNGYDISADALGYPESYYTPPTEAIERIEILRGAAGLQFGTQFGGMINYRFTEPSKNKFSGNFRQTTGSYGFINSFNQVSGTVKKISYNTFYQYKHYEGWRKRSELNSHNAFASIKYQVNEKLAIRAEYTFLSYLSQQPGGLTDKQFYNDPTQVTRNRNWFRVNWNLAALIADYKVTDRTRINLTTFGLVAGRDALGVLVRPDREDDTSANRNLLSDIYKNFGGELRVIHRYALFQNNSHFLIGARYYNGYTDRRQGDADKTANPTFKFLNPDNVENSAYTFPSLNKAIFIENIFQLTKNWNLTPGLRYETITTSSDGYYRLLNKNLSGAIIYDRSINDSRSSTRSFLLGGVGTQLKLGKGVEIYANFSQNYRSINFNDMRVANPNSQVDPNLKDEKGYTIDGGFRGAIKNLLYFDAGVFLLQYNNRIGTALRVDSATYQIVRYRTNIGNSRSSGVEMFAELDWMKLINKESKHKFSTFVNFSYINAFYISNDLAYNNKRVEFVPNIIFRAGLTYAFKKLSFTTQYSYTADQFSDASDAASSPSAIYGIIPAYSVVDCSLNYTWKIWGFTTGVNNLANSSYFTRRTDGYPGPGIIPADPINFYFTFRVKF